MPPSLNDPAAYSALLVTDFGGLTEHFVTTHDILIADGEEAAAALLRRAYVRLERDLAAVARRVALRAAEYIKQEEAQSRVRPDTGGDGGIRLEDFIGDSYPLTDVPGSVGINYEPALYANVPWWWTNEEGYSGHIGRVVHGFFYDSGFTGASRPDPSAFREHPLFRAEGPQRDANGFGPDTHQLDHMGRSVKHAAAQASKGVRPGMVIQNPIPAREFVLRGYQRALSEWHREIQSARDRFLSQLREVSRLLRVAP